MNDKTVTIKIHDNSYKCVVRSFDSSDDNKIYKLYSAWRYLSSTSKAIGCRATNIPEGLSETLFCRVTGAVRIIKSPPGFSTSFDTYDLKRNKRQELKSTSVFNDLTSFSPVVRCDELFWIDLYNNGDFNGHFDIYRLDIESILKVKVNSYNTFEDFQLAGKRPRFSVRKDLVIKQNLSPIFSSNIGINKRSPMIAGKLKLSNKI